MTGQGRAEHYAKYPLKGGMIVTLCLLGQSAWGQSATPGSTVFIDVDVTGNQHDIEKKFRVLPGGVNVIYKDDIPETSNLTLARSLASVPGVIVQSFFGGNDQPRLQIRGSGLQQNPVERGVLMLQNGLPLNRADGSYIVGFANPAQAESIEVYRGYMANRIGATVLGGAINLVSPTGSTAPGIYAEANGGSFGQYGFSSRAAFAKDNYDGLIQFDYSHRDGFRDYNESRRTSVSGNIGFDINEHIKSRVFFGYSDINFDIAGPISKSMLKSHPNRVSQGPVVTPMGPINPGPNVWRDRPRRDAQQYLIGSRTTAEYDAHLFDLAFGYTYTDDSFRFPVSAGVRENSGGDFNALLRYAYNPDNRVLPLLEMSAQYAVGSMDREFYLNNRGRKGDLFGKNDLDSTTLSLFVGLNVPVSEKWTISPSVTYAYAKRDNDDKFRHSRRPTIAFNPAKPYMALPNGAVPTQSTSYQHSYSGWSPSLALSYQINEQQMVYAAVSHSFEPPTHDDLLATVNGTPNSSAGRPNPGNPAFRAAVFATPDLDAQTATTIEAGWRGEIERLSWDVGVYYSWVRNELLSLRDVTGASLGSVNADKTRHFGVEAGIGWRLTDQLFSRLAYTFQDFRFQDDPLRGDNYLAGAPRHLMTASLQYQPLEIWTLGTSVRWSPSRTPVDNMNTLYVDDYVVVDFQTSFKINDHFSIYGEITNIFDEKYASSSTIVDQARPDQAAFLPGDGRGFFVGAKARF